MKIKCKCGATLINNGKLIHAVKVYDNDIEFATLDIFNIICINCGKEYDGNKIKKYLEVIE